VHLSKPGSATLQMKIPGLTRIGKLGGRDAEGFHHVMVKPEYRSVFSGLSDVYLIFNSDRVFYVTISERKQSEKKMWVKFREDGIAEEQPKHKDVLLAIADEAEVTEAEELDELIGYKVLFADKVLGEVQDFFFNGAQQVLQIADVGQPELLVPYVDYYVMAVMVELKSIVLQNAEGLIAFYRNQAAADKP
jgi:ribosomal 30S subunit maturation factor RimM